MTIAHHTAERGLPILLTTVVALSVLPEFGIIGTNSLAQTGTSILWVTGLLLVPTLASDPARMVQQQRFSDLRFRCGRHVRRGAVWIASGLPILVGITAYGTSVSVGQTQLRIPPRGVWAGMLTAWNTAVPVRPDLVEGRALRKGRVR